MRKPLHILYLIPLTILCGCPSFNQHPATAPSTLPATQPHTAVAQAPTTQPIGPAASQPAPAWTFAIPKRTPIQDNAPADAGQAGKIDQFLPAGDPPVFVRQSVTLTVFQNSVPAGKISRNDNFWKHADENAIEPTLHDLLDRNGIRCAIAPLRDFQFFVELLYANPVQAKPETYILPGPQPIELLMKRDIPEQLIAYFDPDGNMPIRTFDESSNFLVVSSQPAPRKAGDLRVTLCPMIRSNRKRFVALGEREGTEVAWVEDKKYFDLNLTTDLPLDSFLILSPSPSATTSTSIGNALFMHDGGAEKYEKVLFIVPQAVKRPEK